MAYNKYDPYGRVVMDRIIAAKRRPVKPRVPGLPEEEDPSLQGGMFTSPTLPPEMANLSLPAEMPKAKPLDLSTPKPQAKVAPAKPIGAETSVIGAAPGTPPPTMAGAPTALDAAGKAIGAGPSITPDMVQAPVLKETFADDPETAAKKAKAEKDAADLKRQQAETGVTSDGSYDPLAGMGAPGTEHNTNKSEETPPPPGGGTEDTGGTQDTPEAAALKRMAAEAEKGQNIEDWQKSEEQKAAETLARQVDEQKARMGGTDNPYAMLAGVGAQGEYLKQLGNINAKEVEMMLESQKNAANMYARLEEWNRQNKPDVYAEFKPKLVAAFGQGYFYDPTTKTVTLGDGTRKSWNELSPDERDLLNDYNNAMGLDEFTGAPGADAADQNLENDLGPKLQGMDSQLDIWSESDADPAEINIANDIKTYVKDHGKAPTWKEVIALYDKYDQNYPPKVDNGEYDPNAPAFEWP